MKWPRPLRALALALLGCSSGPSGPAAPVYPSSDPVVNEVIRGNTAFAADLYARLREQPGNLFFSPESISMALAMATAGARGETLAEMQRTLHFTLDQRRLHIAFGSLLAAWRAPPTTSTGNEASLSSPELFLANRLWCQAGLTLSPDFVAITRDRYGAPVEQVDFQKSPEPSREAINRWVEEQTRDKIKDLLLPGTITPATRLVITNAIYFKGAWASPFLKEQTKDEPFFTVPSRSHPVPMMHQSEMREASYAEVRHAKVLEMPYRSSDQGRLLSLLIVLPDDKDGLPTLESDLSEETISSWVGELRSAPVDVSLPRFKVTAQMELAPTLQQMGMKRAFGGADFSGITADTQLTISNVIHKAFVDVNEEGTEAAAATAVAFAESAMIITRRLTFRADHPFLLILRDRTNGSVLFMGRVVDPVA